MATLLHFLRPLVATSLAGFLLSLGGLSSVLLGLMLLSLSPVSIVSGPVYGQVSQFLTTFGGGDRIEGIIAISLAIGFVAALLSLFSQYKRIQRSEWHLAASRD